MLISEETLQLQKLENEKFKRDLDWQKELVSYYWDCVNDGVLSCKDFYEKTKYFDIYNSELAKESEKVKPISIPEHLKSVANHGN